MQSENRPVQTDEDSAFLLGHLQESADPEEPWENQSQNNVQWLPTEPLQCHETLRHYADVSVNELELGATSSETSVTPISSVFTVHQPERGEARKGAGGRWVRGDGVAAPSNDRLSCALTLALLTTVTCGVITGLAALFMVNKAKARRAEGRHTDSQQWLDYAFATITVSVFIGTPIYVFLLVYHFQLV
ncbi:hypothetical protein ACOMHN_011890 [Nucella lapillus]